MFVSPPTHQPAYWFILSGQKLLLAEAGRALVYEEWQALPFLHHYEDSVIPLDALGDVPAYLVDVGNEQLKEDSLAEVGLREALVHHQEDAYTHLCRAWQLAHFYRTHRYCGQCGSAMTAVDWEYATHCHQCQHRCYPRVSPCIIVAITRSTDILLAQGRRHATDMRSILAGFVESGESLEEAVHREVMEEVGIKVRNLRYFDSQAWPFPHSLMMGFLADYDSGDIVIDDDEIVHAAWYSMTDLPPTPPKLSIAGRLIEAAVTELKTS